MIESVRSDRACGSSVLPFNLALSEIALAISGALRAPLPESSSYCIT